MPSLLRNPLTRRLLRPALSLVEQRVEHHARALQKDLDALHHEVADLRRQSYGLGLLLDHAGRGAHRVPTPTQVDRLVGEVRAVTGAADERVRGEVTVAYRHLVALEALGAGGIGGTVADVCGRLAAVPLLAVGAAADGAGGAAGGGADGTGGAGGGVVEVLESGARHGLFAAALCRMLRRQGVEARLTLVGPLDGAPAREEAVRDDLALGGGRPDGARLVRGRLDEPRVRELVADRRYGVVLLDVPHDGVRALAAPGAVVVAPTPVPGPGPGLRSLGEVADSAYHRATA
ncbi:class I SAM-dependent methyltransferase [Streptomyces sp. TRM76323]|uniref:Class I SAM-dependent methyltransferase n=1 Tax=Streptomyces tamarix TaxID=3078565 RepID=A0ABU3QTB7_9ACTN|nr:class I SAM-dependent methyltransferase [Streptomyces tamarix]MDT9686025.1 class I SAM-dependent methyltransferase [Streptomyces tamarix]